jgi:NADH dehydrogenase
MTVKRILVLGGGFAGLWSALGAARAVDGYDAAADAVSITLVSRDAYHAIRVRNYEADLSAARVPLDDVLGPAGVERVEGEVTQIDVAHSEVLVRISQGGVRTLGYDRLVVALGSELVRPPLPGLADWAFDVDTYAQAARLDAHLRSLPSLPADGAGRGTVLVLGAGLTGIETAMELPERLHATFGGLAAAPPSSLHVVLADRNPQIGSDLGDAARPSILQALQSQRIDIRTGVGIAAIDERGATLASGERIPARTVVWCAGMRAHRLTAQLPAAQRDAMGRLPVDATMRVRGLPQVFAAGDVAAATLDGVHGSVMSCQHARPMGRFAGHNAAADLLGMPLLELRIDRYVTVLDLGPWGAIYLEGWDRRVASVGAEAKRTKQTINRERIYPPRSGDRREILDAAAPMVQAAPMLGGAAPP